MSFHATDPYEQLVRSAYSKARERLKKQEEDIIVLAPCGCSRGSLLELLLKPDEQLLSRAYVYKGFKDKVRNVEQSVEEYEDLEGLAKKLKERKGKLMLVVPESSWDAITLKGLLGERAGLLYLPELYEEAAKGFSGKIRELAKVEHEKQLGKAYKLKSKTEGFSSTLLREWSGKELNDLMKGRETILKLSPGKLGLKDYLEEAAGKTLIALATVPFGMPIVLAVESLLKPLAQLDLRNIVSRLLDRIGKVPAEQVEKLVSRVLEGWSRPEARNKIAKGLAKLVATTRKAEPYLDREELETIVDQVALEWGMGVQEFKSFVGNLTRMVSDELVTREELGQELENRLKQLIEEQLEKIEERLRVVEMVMNVHFTPESLDISFDEEGIVLRNVLAHEWIRYIHNPYEEKLRNAFETVRSGGIVVVRGVKGEGKSSLVKAFLAELMVHEPVIVIEAGDDVDKLKRAVDRIREDGRIPILLYDPSKTGHYPQRPWSEDYMPPKSPLLEGGEMINVVKSVAGGKRIPAIVVLSDDIYKLVEGQLREVEGVEVVEVEVSLKDEEDFLKQLVEEYSGYEGEEVEEIAKAAASFGDNRAVVAVLAGDWLKGRCESKVVEEALRRVRRKVENFILDYIWYVVLGANRVLANTFAPLLFLAGIFGPIPRKLGEAILIKLGKDPDQVRGNEVVKWLSQPLHGTIWEVLCMAASHTISQLEFIKLGKILNTSSALSEAMEQALHDLKNRRMFMNGVCEILKIELEEKLKEMQYNRWRRLALILGYALAGYNLNLIKHIHVLKAMRNCRIPDEALNSCSDLDDLLLVGGIIPPLVTEAVLYSLGPVARHSSSAASDKPFSIARLLACKYREAAEELEKLEEFKHMYEAVYALGLALAVAEAARLGAKLNEGVKTALIAAVCVVPRVQDIESAFPILKAFKPLRVFAPHYYALFLSSASELPLPWPDSEMVNELTTAVDELLQEYWHELEKHTWPLVEAVRVYANLLIKRSIYFGGSGREIEVLMREKMCSLLEDLKGQLRIIAEAFALIPTFYKGFKPCYGEDPASKAEELLEELKKMEQEKPDEQARKWMKARAPGKPEKKFVKLVKEVRGALTSALAYHRMFNDDLENARKLYKNVAILSRKLKLWTEYLKACSMATKCSMLEAGSLRELRKSAKAFKGLWREAKKHEEPTAQYFTEEAGILARYLTYLALKGRKEEAVKLLKKEDWLFGYFPEAGIAAKLLLKILNTEVEDPEPVEVAIVLERHIEEVLRSAFNVLINLVAPEIVEIGCSKFEGEKREICLRAISAVRGDRYTTVLLKCDVLDLLGKATIDHLKGLAQRSKDRETLKHFYGELLEFIDRREASAVVQLLLPKNLLARIILMLWALSRGDEELARAHAKLASIVYEELPRKLFREVAEAHSEEEFKLALLKLF